MRRPFGEPMSTPGASTGQPHDPLSSDARPRELTELERVIAAHKEEKVAIEKTHASERKAILSETATLRASNAGLTTQLQNQNVELGAAKADLIVHQDMLEGAKEQAVALEEQGVVMRHRADGLRNAVGVAEGKVVERGARITELEERIAKDEKEHEATLAEVIKENDRFREEVNRIKVGTLSKVAIAREDDDEEEEEVDRTDVISQKSMPSAQWLRALHVTDRSCLAYNDIPLLQQCNAIHQNHLLPNDIHPSFPLAPDCSHIIPSPIFITDPIEVELTKILGDIVLHPLTAKKMRPLRWMDGEELMAAFSWTFSQLYKTSSSDANAVHEELSRDQMKWLGELYGHYVESIIANKEMVEEYAAYMLADKGMNGESSQAKEE
jgi:hypothetical protein